MSFDAEKFKGLLDEEYNWPVDYHFKFIVKVEQLDDLRKALNEPEGSTRTSSGGKYVSFDTFIHVASSDEVIAIYQKVQSIKGVISL